MSEEDIKLEKEKELEIDADIAAEPDAAQEAAGETAEVEATAEGTGEIAGESGSEQEGAGHDVQEEDDLSDIFPEDGVPSFLAEDAFVTMLYPSDGSEESPEEDAFDVKEAEGGESEETGETGEDSDGEEESDGEVSKEAAAGDSEEGGESAEEPEEPVDPIAERMERRKEKNDPKRRRNAAAWVIAILIVAAAMYGASFLSIFTVTTINVKGNSYFTDEEIINMAHAEVGSNLFHSITKTEMINYLEASPYIIDANITRVIPGTINIKVKERRQLGAIVYDKEYLIIDGEGLLLRRTETRPRITVLTGLKVNKIVIGERLGSTDKVMFEKALRLLSAMEEGKVYFTEIEMGEMFIRAHIYDNLICVGTADQVTDAITSGRLQKVLEELFSRGIKRGTINISDDGYASFNPAV